MQDSKRCTAADPSIWKTWFCSQVTDGEDAATLNSAQPISPLVFGVSWFLIEREGKISHGEAAGVGGGGREGVGSREGRGVRRECRNGQG